MATPPKPPKDPKPAARRAPRKAPATSTARRAAAAPPKQADPVKVEAPKAAAPAKRAKAPATPKPAAAAPAKATAVPKTPRAKAAPRAKAVTSKSTIASLIPTTVALPKAADVTAAAKVVTETVSRNRWTIGAIVAAAGAGLAAFLTRGRISTALGRSEGHVPTDLKPTDGPSLAKDSDERAIPAFRPDMDAPMTDAEREALRPATGSAPTLVSDRGGLNSQ